MAGDEELAGGAGVVTGTEALLTKLRLRGCVGSVAEVDGGITVVLGGPELVGGGCTVVFGGTTVVLGGPELVGGGVTVVFGGTTVVLGGPELVGGGMTVVLGGAAVAADSLDVGADGDGFVPGCRTGAGDVCEDVAGGCVPALGRALGLCAPDVAPDADGPVC